LKFTALLSLLLLLPAVYTAAQPPISYPRVEAVVSFDSVLLLPADEPVSVFHYGEAPSQYAELWLPADTGQDAPVVVFIHGGCWLSEYAIEHSHALATALTQAGYAVWNIEYRRVGEAGGGWPGSLEDIEAALALLITLQPSGVNLDNIVLAGHSAGGHLALLAANQAAQAAAPYPVIGLAPIIDIAGYARGTGSCNRAAIQFMGGTPDAIPELYQVATPTALPMPSHYTVLMGNQDHIVPANPDYLPVGYQAWSSAGHFDWIHPGTPAWREFLSQLSTQRQREQK
jgi:acetyl esterase/lipase